jgi:Tol biopolymer transport system component
VPFHGRHGYELASAILEEAVPPLPAGVPPGLSRIVHRLLSRNRDERYRDAGTVARDLEHLSQPGAAPRAGRRGLIAAGVALTLLLVVYAVWRSVPLRFSDQRLVSTVEASHREPSYSPDGSMLAFTAPDARGVPQVWVRNLAQGTSLQITSGDAAASRPRWSPANDRIVYGVDGQGIWSVSPLGGAATRILDRGAHPNLSRDGTLLVFEDRLAIFTARGDGSDVRLVEGVPAPKYRVPMAPAFSPDASEIAFFRAEVGPNGDLWKIPRAGGQARQLTSDLREGGWPIWTPDGRYIIFSSARGGSRTLWQVPSQGGSPVPLTTGAGEDDQPDIAADGRQIAYTNVRNAWDLRVKDLATGDERIALQRRLEVLFPMFSPDGERIVFFGRADYAVAIFTVRPDGSDLRQLTAGQELNHQPRWGPDGQDVYFFQIRPELSFRRVSALGGPSTKYRDWDWTTHFGPTFDPTGRYIAYVKRLDSERTGPASDRTAILEIETGREVHWAEPHTHVSGWSADGTEVVGSRHDGLVYVCRVVDESCRRVTKGASPVWPGGRGRIYVARPARSEGPQEVWSVAQDGSDERREAALGLFRPIDRFFDVSPDGRRIVWAPFRAGRHEVWIAALR